MKCSFLFSKHGAAIGFYMCLEIMFHADYKHFIESGGFSLHERYGLMKIGYEKIIPYGVVQFDDRIIDIEKFLLKSEAIL
jgi:hypothetical protein